MLLAVTSHVMCPLPFCAKLREDRSLCAFPSLLHAASAARPPLLPLMIRLPVIFFSFLLPSFLFFIFSSRAMPVAEWQAHHQPVTQCHEPFFPAIAGPCQAAVMPPPRSQGMPPLPPPPPHRQSLSCGMPTSPLPLAATVAGQGLPRVASQPPSSTAATATFLPSFKMPASPRRYYYCLLFFLLKQVM